VATALQPPPAGPRTPPSQPSPPPAPRAGPQPAWVRPHRRFRNRSIGTDYLSASGAKWMGGRARRQRDRAPRPCPHSAVPPAAAAAASAAADLLSPLEPWAQPRARALPGCRSTLSTLPAFHAPRLPGSRFRSTRTLRSIACGAVGINRTSSRERKTPIFCGRRVQENSTRVARRAGTRAQPRAHNCPAEATASRQGPTVASRLLAHTRAAVGEDEEKRMWGSPSSSAHLRLLPSLGLGGRGALWRGPRQPRVQSHRRFRNRGTEYVSGIPRMSGGAKRQCDRAPWQPPQRVRAHRDRPVQLVLGGLALGRGTRARVTIDQFRHLALRTC
jgi:hypothetical protein